MKYTSLEQIEKQISMQGKRIEGLEKELSSLKNDMAQKEKALAMADNFDDYEKISEESISIQRKVTFLENQLTAYRNEKLPGLTVEDVAAAVNGTLEEQQKRVDKAYKEFVTYAKRMHEELKKYHDVCKPFFDYEQRVINVLPCEIRKGEGQIEEPEEIHFVNIPWIGNTKRLISYLYDDDIKQMFDDLYLRIG